MNIVICDDERKVIEDVGSICREYLSPDVKLYGFRSAESLLKNLDKIEGDIDLFILDIEMPGRDGLWLRKELERYRYGSSIIYLTSHDELVQEAFGRYVIGFVDKVSFLNDKNKLVDKLKHELTHVWLYEYGHNQNDDKTFSYEDVCEVVASSNDFINEIIKEYVRRT